MFITKIFLTLYKNKNMAQPIPKKILEERPDFKNDTFNTLLIDGSNLLELSSLGDKTTSNTGKPIGGIFQFLLQVKLLLKKGNFRYVYVFWDGVNSGQKRYELNTDYKSNRDKQFVDNNLSDYMKAVNSRIKYMENIIYKKKDPIKLQQDNKQKEVFHWQREVLLEILEELCVRQCIYDETEADDFIGYYVTHKKDNERIVIVSNDRDLTQLISEDVILYVQSLKSFINTKNHTKIMGYDYRNVVLKKMLCGDVSDNIKGIKGFGEKTLYKYFDEIKAREITLNEVLEKAENINETRKKEKKKPLKWAENIINKVTDGKQGEKIYEINKLIIDLKNPLMPEEAKEYLDDIMYSPMDCEDRSMENLYKIIIKYDIDKLYDSNVFGAFFSDFLYLIDKERKNI